MPSSSKVLRIPLIFFAPVSPLPWLVAIVAVLFLSLSDVLLRLRLSSTAAFPSAYDPFLAFPFSPLQRSDLLHIHDPFLESFPRPIENETKVYYLHRHCHWFLAEVLLLVIRYPIAMLTFSPVLYSTLLFSSLRFELS